MNRKEFIESQGATCKNWNWSWSFVNHDKKIVIFGAWKHLTRGGLSLILDESWKINRFTGRKAPGYNQSREHVRLIEEEGYKLRIFFMQESHDMKGETLSGPTKIAGFEPKLHRRKIKKIGTGWHAVTEDAYIESDAWLPEEIVSPGEFYEGASKAISINAYERNAAAKRECLKHNGYSCSVCDFNFADVYGSLGEKYIHVHHVKPLSEIRAKYRIDPKKDLVPVCPNCHSMIHRSQPALTIQELRQILSEQKKS